MDWSILICLILLDSCRGRYVDSSYEEDAKYVPTRLEEPSMEKKILQILRLIKRRYDLRDRDDLVVDQPVNPEDLPEAEPIHPGHTLIRPALGMLKSAVKFPHRDSGTYAVYGNLNNLGITYGKSPYRISYTGFRKTNNGLPDTILKAAKHNDKRKRREEGPPLVILKSKSGERRNLRSMKMLLSNGQMVSEEDNTENISNEIEKEDSDASEDDEYRRNGKKIKSKFRDRSDETSKSDSCYNKDDDSSSSSGSGSIEKNPGNPYTIHKNKYKQNWLWNHVMDGDHMNINPYGPEFKAPGPSGADLFFGRKWWYFNQDDYKPFR